MTNTAYRCSLWRHFRRIEPRSISHNDYLPYRHRINIREDLNALCDRLNPTITSKLEFRGLNNTLFIDQQDKALKRNTKYSGNQSEFNDTVNFNKKAIIECLLVIKARHRTGYCQGFPSIYFCSN